MPRVKGRIRAEGGEDGRPSEEGLLVRSKNSWPCHVALAVDTFLEAHERVLKALHWGFTHGFLRMFAKSRSLGSAERLLRDMVPKMALHERVVNTVLGLHPRVAPGVGRETFTFTGEASVARNGVHDGCT